MGSLKNSMMVSRVTVTCFKESPFPLLPEISIRDDGDRTVVTKVSPGGVFAKAGVTEGDVIQSVNDTNFKDTNANKLFPALSKLTGTVKVVFVDEGFLFRPKKRKTQSLPRLYTSEISENVNANIEEHKNASTDDSENQKILREKLFPQKVFTSNTILPQKSLRKKSLKRSNNNNSFNMAWDSLKRKACLNSLKRRKKDHFKNDESSMFFSPSSGKMLSNDTSVDVPNEEEFGETQKYNLIEQIKKLTKSLEEKDEKIVDLNNMIEEKSINFDEEIRNMRKENLIQSKKVLELEIKEREHLVKKATAAEEKCLSDAVIRKLREDLDKVLEENNTAKEYAMKNGELEKEVLQNDEKNKDLKSQIKFYKEFISQMKVKEEKIRNDNESVIFNTTAKIAEIEKENSNLKYSMKKYVFEIDELKKKNKQNESKIFDLEKTNKMKALDEIKLKDLKSSLLQKTELIDRLEKENKNLLRQNIENYPLLMEKAKSRNLEEEVKTLERDNRKLAATLKKYNGDNSPIVNELIVHALENLETAKTPTTIGDNGDEVTKDISSDVKKAMIEGFGNETVKESPGDFEISTGEKKDVLDRKTSRNFQEIDQVKQRAVSEDKNEVGWNQLGSSRLGKRTVPSNFKSKCRNGELCSQYGVCRCSQEFKKSRWDERNFRGKDTRRSGGKEEDNFNKERFAGNYEENTNEGQISRRSSVLSRQRMESWQKQTMSPIESWDRRGRNSYGSGKTDFGSQRRFGGYNSGDSRDGASTSRVRREQSLASERKFY